MEAQTEIELELRANMLKEKDQLLLDFYNNILLAKSFIVDIKNSWNYLNEEKKEKKILRLEEFLDNELNIEYYSFRFRVYKPEKNTDIEIFSNILDKVSEVTEVRKHEIIGQKRLREIVICRQYITAVLRDRHGFMYSSIGRLLNKDHSSIIHLYQKHEDDMMTSNTYMQNYIKIIKELYE